MTHQRSIFTGMTDYTGVPLEDILQHLRDWCRHIDSSVEILEHEVRKIEKQSTSFESPEEAIAFAKYFVDLFRRYRGDLNRLIIELPNGISPAHIEIVEQLYKSSRSEDQLTVEFKHEWISRPLPQEEARSVLDTLYSSARGLLLSLKDLSNLLPRLRTFVGVPAVSDVFPELELKPNISGIGVNLNRLLGRIRRWWLSR